MKQRKIRLTMTEAEFRLICVALHTQAQVCREEKIGLPDEIEKIRKELFARVYPALCAWVPEPMIAEKL